MIFFTTLTSVSVMAAMMIVGVLLRRAYGLTLESQRLVVALIVNVGLPSIVLSSVFNFELDATMMKQILTIFVLSVIINAGGIILARFLAKKYLKTAEKQANELAIAATLGNTAFIGIPLCYVLLGAQGALLAAIFDAGLDFVIWTLCIYLLQHDKGFRLRNLAAMINIPLLAIVIGLTLGALQFEAHDGLKQLTKALAGLASPIGMIYIGMLIPDLWKMIRDIDVKRVTYGVIFKILLFPLLAFGFILLLPIDDIVIKVLLIQVTMPTFTLASVLFQRYGADVNFGTAMTLISVMASLITIPCMLYLLHLIGLNF
ncbi:AEC family transporter [Wohlfahrtiimonas chitiniclastica]|uniref:AEC family transporter n=1 Tax=Wohlfahrtiimonas chitiniclastica TaxID=400946 RepID=UPI001BD0DC27|nr:AEC family transporter [Wohlfahrtiimonas chitiniclastica]MBS7838508.1 AEC family transporter [Wohlfahrtiimonas chitiniclastica]